MGHQLTFELLEDKFLLAAITAESALERIVASYSPQSIVCAEAIPGTAVLSTAIFREDLGCNASLAPVITSNGGGPTTTVDVLEGTSAVTTVVATGTPTPTFSITSGVDQARFTINTVTGALAFKSSPQYSNPTDANLDNDYVVRVTATNIAGSINQTITVAVRDWPYDDVVAPTNPDLLAAFKADGIVGSCHFGLETYVPLCEIPSEWGTGCIDVNTFNPPPDFSFLPYLQYMKNIGCKAVMLTAKHLGGFALWPSDVDSDYCIADTAWYQNTHVDLVQMFDDQAHSLGLDVGFYFCVYDAHQALKAGGYGTYNGAYRTAELGEINELVTRYADLKFILLDGWGDTWPQFDGPGYSDLPYATVINDIRAHNPNCLITVNDHENYAYGDFQTYEGPGQGEPPAGNKPILYWQPIQLNGDCRWFTHSDSPAENVAVDIPLNIGRRDRTIANGNVWGPNVSIGPDGVLPDDLREILTGLGLTAGDYNHDSTVSAADYVSWRNSLGTSAMPGTGADGDGSGVVDNTDYVVWRANFGSIVVGSATCTAAAPVIAQALKVAMPSAVAFTEIGHANALPMATSSRVQRSINDNISPTASAHSVDARLMHVSATAWRDAGMTAWIDENRAQDEAAVLVRKWKPAYLDYVPVRGMDYWKDEFDRAFESLFLSA